MNNVTISGRLCHDVELKTTTTGKAVASVTVAVDDRFNRDKAHFIKVTVWGSSSEFLANYAQKGTIVGVEGRLEQRTWEKDNIKHNSVEVVASNVSILDWSTAQERGGSPNVTINSHSATYIEEEEFDPFA